ncbi:hypothetical protein KCP78_04355 [Salmonella enterica subsp. enterica]|nr:hypothetical protein KCP78_04355 [Salmonella enterica subsp. enterica]
MVAARVVLALVLPLQLAQVDCAIHRKISPAQQWQQWRCIFVIKNSLLTNKDKSLTLCPQIVALPEIALPTNARGYG